MSSPTKTIVIGTSLTAASDDVVRAAVATARATGARPWLVHAYTLPVFPSEMGVVDTAWIAEQAQELRRQALDQAVRTGLAALPGYGFVQVRVEPGPPHQEIVRLAREARADLIVVGAAEGGSRLRMLGSTADRVVRKARCPVLVVRPAVAFPPRTVEIPVDLSRVAANGLRRGLEFLAELGVPLGATEVLFVLNPLEMAGSVHFTREQVERFAAGELRRFLAVNVRAGARPAAAAVRSGFARQEIVAVLAERQVDLAILGTHGRSGFDRLVLGSVAAGVLHEAGCNVLVVPPGEAAEAAAAEPEDADGERVGARAGASVVPQRAHGLDAGRAAGRDGA